MKRKGILSAIVLVLFSGCKTVQLTPEQASAKEAAQTAQYEGTLQALNDREFVLEADRIDFKRGRFVYVSAYTNFVSVQGDRATIQLAFNSPYAGPNGIGGITVEGSVSDFKTSTDRRGNTNASMMVQGAAVSAMVNIVLIKDSNTCTATVSPNFNSNNISFSGNLYPESESNVFKGRSL